MILSTALVFALTEKTKRKTFQLPLDSQDQSLLQRKDKCTIRVIQLLTIRLCFVRTLCGAMSHEVGKYQQIQKYVTLKAKLRI